MIKNKMDKNLLTMLRKQYNLNIETLPDTISSDDLVKLIENQSKKFIKEEDFKNLQKKLSEKDLEIKKITDKQKKGSSEFDLKIKEMSETIIKMTSMLENVEKRAKIENLSKKYPDILPDLLVDKTDEEIEQIVDKQRLINKKLYSDSQFYNVKDTFSSEEDIDEAIEKVKTDKSKSGENSAVEILKINRQRENF